MITSTGHIPNVIHQFAAAAIIGAATIGLQLILARQLGPTTFGFYGIATSITGIVFILQDGGFRTLLYREATHPSAGFPSDRTILSIALGYNLLVSGISLVLTVGILGYGYLVSGAVAVLVITNTGRIVSLDLSSLMRARNRFELEARWQIANRLSVVALMVVAILLTDDLITILAAGAIAQFGILLLPLRTIPKPDFRFDPALFRACGTLVAIELVTALYFRCDVLMMAAFGRSPDEIGVYAALTRMIEAYIFVVAPIATVFFRSARLSIGDTRWSSRALWFLIILIEVPALVILAITVQYREAMVYSIFGAQYQGGAGYLPWLIGACCGAGPNALLGQLLLARNRERYFLAAVIGALVVNVSLNAGLIPIRGAEGAAQTTCVTELALMFFLIAALYTPIRNSTIRECED